MRLIAATLLLAIGLPHAFAVSRSYEIEVVNSLPSRAKIAFTQYHAPDFGTTRPKEFAESLKLRTKTMDIAPGATKAIRFTDATGGFWVRWCRLEPKPNAETCG